MFRVKNIQQKIVLTCLTCAAPFILLLLIDIILGHSLPDHFVKTYIPIAIIASTIIGAYGGLRTSLPLINLAEEIQKTGRANVDKYLESSPYIEVNVLCNALKTAIQNYDKQLKYLKGMVDLKKAVNSTTNLAEVEKKAERKIAELFGAVAVWILLYNEKSHLLEMHRIYCKKDYQKIRILYRDVKTKPGKGFSGKVFSLQKEIIIKNIKNTNIPFKEVLADFNINCLLGLPLSHKDETLGVIGLAFRENITLKTAKLINVYTSQIANAIHNANLYRFLENQADKLVMLHGLSLKLNKYLDEEKILKVLLKGAAMLTGSNYGKICYSRQSHPLQMFSYKKGKNRAYVKQSTLTSREQDLFKNKFSNRKITYFKSDKLKKELDLARIHNFPNYLALIPATSPYHHLNCFLIIGKDNVFSDTDKAICEILAAHAVVALINARNFNQEHHIADTLQSSLLPSLPSHDQVDLGFVYRTATSGAMVGGDFLDFFTLDNNHIGLVIGDVSGKGIKAATSTAKAKNTLRAFAYENPLPSEVMSRVNNALSNEESSFEFITMAYGLLDLSTGKLSYVLAGHHPLLVYKNLSCELLRLEEGSIPLGVVENENFKQGQTYLLEDDILIFYTDGLIEARNSDEMYGLARLEEKIKQLCDLGPSAIVNAVIADVEHYTKGELADDIAIFAIKVKSLKTSQDTLFNQVGVAQYKESIN
ncbi:MAG: hypothetical protein C4562_01000 [Actinobacteria bacterium]|nr:MAG: hypothetical protein C4562_01000 [Actinomycetota bacterium]